MNIKIKNYFAEVSKAIAGLPHAKLEEFKKVILEAHQKGNRIFVIGNGGSASTSSHFMCDVNKIATDPRWVKKGTRKFRVIALTDNVPLITAWGNDQDFADIFAEQIDNLVEKGDVLLAISASGNSENIIRGVKKAKQMGAVTLGLAGFGGGRLTKEADHCIVVDSSHYGVVEDAHHSMCHALAYGILDTLMFRQAQHKGDQ